MEQGRSFETGKGAKMRLTRQGKWLTLMVVLLLLPAYWLSVALLFLMAAVLVSLLAYNWLSVLRSLGGVGVTVRAPREAFAGQPVDVSLVLVQASRWRRLCHLELRLEGVDFEPGSAVVPILGPGECERAVVIRPERRGWLTLARCRLRLAYPFGLVEVARDLALAERLLVYPRPAPGRGETLEAMHEVQSLVPRGNDDFVYLDSYRPGEDVRRIHWKKSTLSEQPVIRKDLTQLERVFPRLLVPDPCSHFEAALSLLTTYFLRAGTAAGWAILTTEGVVEVRTWEDMLGQLALTQPLAETYVEAYLEQGYEILRLSQVLPGTI